jgi:Tol biopolymer transport system component
MRASAPAAALLALLAQAACDGPVSPGTQEQILFKRYVDPSSLTVIDSVDIYRINADGTGLQNLTRHPALYGPLSLSPDGRKVAFHSNRGGTVLEYVWVMNTDGTALERITTAHAAYPRWSPDGSRIAAMMDGDDGWHVYVMNADGTDPVKVSGPAMQVGGSCSVGTGISLVGWMGNGRIGFWRHYCGYGVRYFIVNADGTGFQQTEIDLWTTFWSPDGTRAVTMRYEGGYWRVILMNADGTGARVLSTQGTHQGLPWGGGNPWSRDGKRVVFFADTTTAQGQPWGQCRESVLPYVVNVDGTNVRRLMDSCYGYFHDWSSSGDRILFTIIPPSPPAGANRPVPDLFVVRADGTGAENITNSPEWEDGPLWLPRP